MKIAACVVIFNPDEGMVDNLLSYSDSVEDLFIIDNSPNENSVFANFANERGKSQYIFFGENRGIAYALNHGCQLALEKGYDWILTMDQDSRFIDSNFFNIVEEETAKAINTDVAIYAASYTAIRGRWFKLYNSEFEAVHFAITSGNCVNLNRWKEVGGFDVKLFIDEVDHDFCVKLRLLKCHILTSKRIVMTHTVGVLSDADSTEKQTRARPQPLRFYYITRNGLLMVRRYFFKDFLFAFNRFFFLNKALLRILFLYPEKRKYIKYFFLGVFDFFRSKYGRIS